jgi:hypothetical protein
MFVVSLFTVIRFPARRLAANVVEKIWRPEDENKISSPGQKSFAFAVWVIDFSKRPDVSLYSFPNIKMEQDLKNSYIAKGFIGSRSILYLSHRNQMRCNMLCIILKRKNR